MVLNVKHHTPKEMNIIVEMPCGETLTLEVNDNWTVNLVKKAIDELKGSEYDHFLLKFNGKHSL